MILYIRVVVNNLDHFHIRFLLRGRGVVPFAASPGCRVLVHVSPRGGKMPFRAPERPMPITAWTGINMIGEKNAAWFAVPIFRLWETVLALVLLFGMFGVT